MGEGMSTTAVLLIIGAAVVGPIEAQPNGYDPLTEGRAAYCKERYWDKKALVFPSVDGDCLSRRSKMPNYETLPELCARAMREIGAGTDNGMNWFLHGVRDESKNLKQILCIPAPTGLKR